VLAGLAGVEPVTDMPWRVEPTEKADQSGIRFRRADGDAHDGEIAEYG
jgi:hypothetical protein